MKVKDLILELEKYDPEATVRIKCLEDWFLPIPTEVRNDLADGYVDICE